MKKACALLALLFLAACASQPMEPPVPDLNFTSVAPVHLDVASIEVKDNYVPPQRAPNVDHLFKTPPVVAVHNLLDHALTGGGGTKTLRVTIVDASVVDKPLLHKENILGALARTPSDRYEAKVTLRFELFDPAAPDIIAAHAEVAAQRTRTLFNNDSPAARDRAAFELTEILMKDVESGLRDTVQRTFGKK